MERYDLYDGRFDNCEMRKFADGDYALYTDAAALEQSLAAVTAERDAFKGALRDLINMPPRRDTSRWACQQRVKAKRNSRMVMEGAALRPGSGEEG